MAPNFERLARPVINAGIPGSVGPLKEHIVRILGSLQQCAHKSGYY